MSFVGQDYYQEEEVELVGTQFNKADLIETLRTQAEVWFHFLMGELLTHAVPEFHVDIFNLLINFAKSKFALAVPRGHAKTTVVKLAVVWYFVFSPIKFIVYCSNTTSIAIQECRDIIKFIESDNFRAVFGAVHWEKKSESEGLWIFKINDKLCILKALGAGQQVRGLNIENTRPQLLICDDAEDDENSATIEQRKKFRRWVFGPLFKACARKSKKIWIGNLVGAHCLINDLCESEFWDSIKYGAILANGQPLWPEMWSLAELREDYLEYYKMGQAAKWFAEMMNMPVPEGMGLLQAEDITYAPARSPVDLDYGFITIDPAISKKTRANKSAIAVHGMIENKWQIVDFHTAKLGPLELFQESLRLARQWRIRVIGIENVAYQAALEPIFKFLLAMEQEFAIEVVQLHAAGQKKVERIVTWAGWIKNGTYQLTENEQSVTTQLLCYDPEREENDDDLIDACAYGPQMIAEHLNLIMFNPIIAVQTEMEGEYTVCAH